MSNLKIFLLFFIILVESARVANAFTLNKEDVEQFAQEFVLAQLMSDENAKIEVTTRPIDPRIDIRPCELPLAGELPSYQNQRSIIVHVSCTDTNNSWTMYVPVRVSHQIPVLVATERLDKGTSIEPNNISIEYKDVSSIRSQTFANPEQFYGAKTKRRIAAGAIIGNQNICFVCKGETVTIEAKSLEFSIKTAGIALSDGNLGDTIKVKNSRSAKIIDAQIVAVNLLQINL